MYQTLIREIVGDDVPAYQVEAFMRLEYPTLDGLSRGKFRAEALLAAACVREMGFAASEKIAVSMGLKVMKRALPVNVAAALEDPKKTLPVA